jgi:acyl-CoA reductase-like NAD-dependent aldehyde dehydrogenase
MPFDTPEDALRIANDSLVGLSGAIHTRDLNRVPNRRSKSIQE